MSAVLSFGGREPLRLQCGWERPLPAIITGSGLLIRNAEHIVGIPDYVFLSDRL